MKRFIKLLFVAIYAIAVFAALVPEVKAQMYNDNIEMCVMTVENGDNLPNLADYLCPKCKSKNSLIWIDYKGVTNFYFACMACGEIFQIYPFPFPFPN